MSFGGGRDREELASYNPQEYLESDDPDNLMGCHKGIYGGLNVSNAQPGFFYAWADDSPRSLLIAKQQRYQVVSAQDPEMAGYRKMVAHDQRSDLDSTNSGFAGVVLVRRSARDEAWIRNIEAEKRHALLRSGDTEQAYLNSQSADEVRQGGKRFLRPDPRSYATEGPSEAAPVVESWSPNHGISS